MTSIQRFRQRVIQAVLATALFAAGSLAISPPADAETVWAHNSDNTTTCGGSWSTYEWDDFSEAIGGVPIEAGWWRHFTSKVDPSYCRSVTLNGRASRLYGEIGALDSSGTKVGTVEIRIDGQAVVGTSATRGTRVPVDLDIRGAQQLQMRINCLNPCAGEGQARPAVALKLVLPEDFVDVGLIHHFYPEIRWAAERGVTEGFSDGQFKPTQPVSRQAILAFLFRALGEPAGIYLNPGFTDVGGGHLFAREISWAVTNGLTNGYADGSFKPTASVTRQALAAFIYRLAGEPEGPFDDPGFWDVPPDHAFYTSIAWMASEGLTTGFGDGSFKADQPVSRQAAVAFIARYFS